MLDPIRRLGSRIEYFWKKRGYQRHAFPEVAVRALEEAQIHRSIRPRQIINGCLRSRSLPRQLELTNNFGDPPVTVFWRPKKFLIDAYFWLEPKISIHDHSFSGAFAVLQGSSLQCVYNFERTEAFHRRLFLGKLELRLQERLRPGDIRPIVSGPGFIHEVWHIGRPTVSLVVRTITDDVPQHRYYPDNLAVCTSLPKDPLIVKRAAFLRHLHKLGDPQAESCFLDLLKSSDPYAGFHYTLTHLREAGDPARAFRILGNVSRRHRVWLGPVEAAYRFEQTAAQVDWSRCDDEDSRLFLALLLSSPDRRTIFAALSRENPRVPPPEQIINMIRRLDQSGAVDLALSSLALGVLALLLEGRTAAQVFQVLRQRRRLPGGRSVESKCLQLCASLRRVPLLKPLFV